MADSPHPSHLVAIIGAGPAGLFAARELAQHGQQVVLFNRDIKPGGLAEYGIFPDKIRMRLALAAQFKQILSEPCLAYYGNVLIGQEGDLTLENLRSMGFQAILVTVGAQAAKTLGIPGEMLQGVYHAKDLVYHYNLLPPYSQQSVSIGERVAVVGMGNVMLDIAHWLISSTTVKEITAIARRGPAEVKFDRKEMEPVIGSLNLPALDAEMERVAPMMLSVGEDPAEAKAKILAALPGALPVRPDVRFMLHFLASPARILGDDHNRVRSVELEDNALAIRSGEIVARGLQNRHQLEVNNIIFAIGDTVDETLGLPIQNNEYVKNQQPRFPVEDVSYEVYDPKAGRPVEDVFVAGWARRASTGLVGLARKDGTNGANAVSQYLGTLPPARPDGLKALHHSLMRLHRPAVTRADLARLETIEIQEAAKRSMPYFKFSTNDEMLIAMGLKDL